MFSTQLKRNMSTLGSVNRIRKFYKEATFELNPNPVHPKHKYLIKLDDKTIKTPNKHILCGKYEKLYAYNTNSMA